MQKDICDYCGKEVKVLNHPAIHGWLDISQQYDKTAGLKWFSKSFCGLHREERFEKDAGIWCDFECFVKDMAKKFDREFEGLYPKKEDKCIEKLELIQIIRSLGILLNTILK